MSIYATIYMDDVREYTGSGDIPSEDAPKNMRIEVGYPVGSYGEWIRLSVWAEDRRQSRYSPTVTLDKQQIRELAKQFKNMARGRDRNWVAWQVWKVRNKYKMRKFWKDLERSNRG